MPYRLHLLGPPKLASPRGVSPLERKTAAVLAYLALEGPTPKYKLAGWLWPDSGESTARNNMRQLLRRLRVGLGEVVLGEDRLELAPEAEVDVKQLSYLEAPSHAEPEALSASGKAMDPLCDAGITGTRLACYNGLGYCRRIQGDFEPWRSHRKV